MSHEIIVRFPPHDGENEIFDYFKTTSLTCEIKYAIHLLMHIYYKEYILRSYHKLSSKNNIPFLHIILCF